MDDHEDICLSLSTMLTYECMMLAGVSGHTSSCPSAPPPTGWTPPRGAAYRSQSSSIVQRLLDRNRNFVEILTKKPVRYFYCLLGPRSASQAVIHFTVSPRQSVEFSNHLGVLSHIPQVHVKGYRVGRLENQDWAVCAVTSIKTFYNACKGNFIPPIHVMLTLLAVALCFAAH